MFKGKNKSSTFTASRKKKKVVDYGAIDRKLIRAIDKLSKENKRIWTSPNYNRRENVHSFFQYPAMMVPIVQKHLIETVTTLRPDIKIMLDPYMGSGTSIIASMQSGLSCYGQDINPLAILLSRVKSGPYQYIAFRSKAKELIALAKQDDSIRILKNFPNREKWFKSNVSIELSRLVRAIRKEKSIAARRIFWVTIAETVRLTSNDRTSTYKLHARPDEEIARRNPSPISVFENLIKNIIDDVKSHAIILRDNDLIRNGSYRKKISISLVNSRQRIKQSLKLGRPVLFDLLVSSPPYGDNKTTIPYGQHAYLPLQWIDLKDIDPKVTSDCLKSTSAIDSQSLGGKRTAIQLKELEDLFDQAPVLERTIKSLGKQHKDKVKKVVNFIYDFKVSLDLIGKSIKPNGYMIWTIGNRRVGDIQIKNDRILIELLEFQKNKLVKVIGRTILNKRMARKNQASLTMNKEKILIFRKSG